MFLSSILSTVSEESNMLTSDSDKYVQPNCQSRNMQNYHRRNQVTWFLKLCILNSALIVIFIT
jgi:hypothetical protein